MAPARPLCWKPLLASFPWTLEWFHGMVSRCRHRSAETPSFICRMACVLIETRRSQVVSFFAGVYRRSKAETADTINSVGLRPVLHKRVHALSKGYNRRLLLALALLAPHPVLLMDEPFDGFDLRQTHEIVDLFRTEAARGRTFILAIHQLADAERVCDRLILLAAGRVRGSGTLDELRAQTRLPAGSLEDIFLALT